MCSWVIKLDPEWAAKSKERDFGERCNDSRHKPKAGWSSEVSLGPGAGCGGDDNDAVMVSE